MTNFAKVIFAVLASASFISVTSATAGSPSAKSQDVQQCDYNACVECLEAQRIFQYPPQTCSETARPPTGNEIFRDDFYTIDSLDGCEKNCSKVTEDFMDYSETDKSCLLSISLGLILVLMSAISAFVLWCRIMQTRRRKIVELESWQREQQKILFIIKRSQNIIGHHSHETY